MKIRKRLDDGDAVLCCVCMTSPPRDTKPQTIDALRIFDGNPDVIVQAGEVADMRFQRGQSLSLRAAKLFLMLVQAAGARVVEDQQHRIPYSVLNQTFHRGKGEMLDAIDELHGTTISVRVASAGSRPFTRTGPILSGVEREDDDLIGAEVRFEFSRAMRDVIRSSTHWAAISRRAVMAFESKYALRLYLVLALRSGLRKTTEDFDLDDFRALVGVEAGTLAGWQAIRRRVLEPARAEINMLAGFHMEFAPIKRGRKVIGVKLIWGRKGSAELVAASKELERPRVGRKARRAGAVDDLAEQQAHLRSALAEELAAAPQQGRKPSAR
jgi:hypothetical protein